MRFQLKPFSMVNQKRDSIHWTTTFDLLKSYSPKVFDDSFGSLLTRVAFGSPDRSDFCGASLPEIASLKFCDGSLLARVVSIIPDCADFLPVMWFSLGCSADSSTTASMVFDLYTSQASLYVWNSFIPGFIEFLAPRGETIDGDILFGQIPWLNLRLELMFIYGSLPRPPDVQFIVVRMCFLTLDVVDCDVLWRYLPKRNALREGELRLEDLKRILEYEIDKGCLILLLEHLNCKWGNSSYTTGELMLFTYNGLLETITHHQWWTHESSLSSSVNSMVGSPSVLCLRYDWFVCDASGSLISQVSASASCLLLEDLMHMVEQSSYILCSFGEVLLSDVYMLLSAKLSIQLFPLDECTRRFLKMDKNNPHMALTLINSKKISCVRCLDFIEETSQSMSSLTKHNVRSSQKFTQRNIIKSLLPLKFFMSKMDYFHLEGEY